VVAGPDIRGLALGAGLAPAPVEQPVPAVAGAVPAAVPDHHRTRGDELARLRAAADAGRRRRRLGAGAAAAVRPVPAGDRARHRRVPPAAGAGGGTGCGAGGRLGAGQRRSGREVLRRPDGRRSRAAPSGGRGFRRTGVGDAADGRSGRRRATAAQDTRGDTRRIRHRGDGGTGVQRDRDPHPAGPPVHRWAGRSPPAAERLADRVPAVCADDPADRRGRRRHGGDAAVVHPPGRRHRQGPSGPGSSGHRTAHRPRAAGSHRAGSGRHHRAGTVLDRPRAPDDGGSRADGVAGRHATRAAARDPRSEPPRGTDPVRVLRDGGAGHGVLPGLRGGRAGIEPPVAPRPPGGPSPSRRERRCARRGDRATVLPGFRGPRPS
jgi:hypothetical protein